MESLVTQNVMHASLCHMTSARAGGEQGDRWENRKGHRGGLVGGTEEILAQARIDATAQNRTHDVSRHNCAIEGCPYYVHKHYYTPPPPPPYTHTLNVPSAPISRGENGLG